MTTFAYSARETNSGIVYDFGTFENNKLNVIGTSPILHYVKLMISSPGLCEFVRICAYVSLPRAVIQETARQILQEAGLEVENIEPMSDKNQLETKS